MNNYESANGTSTNTNKSQNKGFASDSWDPSSQLKAIGDQIEVIAKRLENQGKDSECDALRELGTKVSHFMKEPGSDRQLGSERNSGNEKKSESAKVKSPQAY